MNEKDMLGQANRILGGIDYAKQLKVAEQEHDEHLDRVLLNFIEALDSFERFLAAVDEEREESASEQERSWLNTFRLMKRQMKKALEKADVETIACLGLRAQPGQHEIVDAREVAGGQDDVIVDVLFQGYKRDGRTLRKPKVVIAKGSDSDAKEE